MGFDIRKVIGFGVACLPAAVPIFAFGESMTLAFKARFVSCADAIDGDLLQVTFDTKPRNEDEDGRCTPYVLLSCNFEFPGPSTIEWHDGTDYDGGAKIIALILTRDRVLIKLDQDLDIDVSFRIGDRRFAKLSSCLKKMLDEDVFLAN